VNDWYYRCSGGHLFVTSWPKLVFLSVHFGPSKFLRCPVDGHWRMARRVYPGDLTQAELDAAKQYRF
jgi:hypothetical protein